MTKSFKIESISVDQVTLKDDDQKMVFLPKSFFTAKLLVGDQVLLSISETRDLVLENKELAQEILNELLRGK